MYVNSDTVFSVNFLPQVAKSIIDITLAALGQMSAGLAHEIRNPLGVIKGSAEMLTQKLKESNPLGIQRLVDGTLSDRRATQ